MYNFESNSEAKIWKIEFEAKCSFRATTFTLSEVASSFRSKLTCSRSDIYKVICTKQSSTSEALVNPVQAKYSWVTNLSDKRSIQIWYEVWHFKVSLSASMEAMPIQGTRALEIDLRLKSWNGEDELKSDISYHVSSSWRSSGIKKKCWTVTHVFIIFLLLNSVLS